MAFSFHAEIQERTGGDKLEYGDNDKEAPESRLGESEVLGYRLRIIGKYTYQCVHGAQ